jgi:hypothetical protein
MTALANPRHEMFAQHVPNGRSQVDAYARVSYSRNHGHASRLAALEPTRQRVAELQRRNVTRQDDVIAVTTDELQSMTRATYELAMEMARQAEALVAVMTLAKLSGLWVETTPRRGKIDPKMLSNEELMTLIAAAGRTGSTLTRFPIKSGQRCSPRSVERPPRRTEKTTWCTHISDHPLSPEEWCAKYGDPTDGRHKR